MNNYLRNSLLSVSVVVCLTDATLSLPKGRIDNKSAKQDLPRINFETELTSVNEEGTDTPGISPTECIKYTDYLIKVTIDAAPSDPITVSVRAGDPVQENLNYATEGGKADFQIISATVILQEGELSKEVTLRVFNDAIEEPDEIIPLTMWFADNGNAELGENSNISITIEDDDTSRRSTVDALVSETFDASTLPTDWVTDPGTYDSVWGIDYFEDDPPFRNRCLHLHYVGSHEFREKFERYIDTPEFNTLGYSELSLSFDHILYFDLDSNEPLVEAQIWTGSAWVTFWELNHSTEGYPISPTHVDATIPLQYASANSKIRFTFLTYHTGNWKIDNVIVNGTKFNQPIQNEITETPDSEYLGPNATVFFYDPQTNGILAKVTNLSAHDYGCTSVEIDRAGDGTSEWLGYNISDKTLRVVPSNPDPAGKYEITLYYTAAELGDFAESITSMGKSEGGIGVGDASSSNAVPVNVSKYNDDYAFTATFENGFSGFGVSDAPPGTSLPVRLLSFEGTNTSEGNILHWVTTEEVNNDHFAVERSYDAKKFNEISRVPALTILSNSNNYYYTDSEFDLATSYYRLKQVDKDGKYAYSNTISVKSKGLPLAMAYPNPASDQVVINLPKYGPQKVNLRIYSIVGAEVLSKDGLTLSNNQLVQDISGLSPGLYVLRIIGSGSEISFNMLKK